MSTEIIRLREKVVHLGEAGDNLLDRILRLEARLEELEQEAEIRAYCSPERTARLKLIQGPRRKKKAVSLSDVEIVERWKAGGCVMCGEPIVAIYSCKKHYEADSQGHEWHRRAMLCDAAVKEGK